MHLLIQKLNNNIIHQALEYFSEAFIDDLKTKSTFNESLVARYFIEQNPNKYSSISHKKNLVFIGTNDKKIGVDIEVYKQRDISLFDKFHNEEYSVLGDKNWENFYILWTAKESLIKLLGLQLDNISEIMLIQKKEVNQNISSIDFKYKLYLKYHGKNYIVFNGKNGENIFSICC